MERINLSEKLTVSRLIQGFWRLDTWQMATRELAGFISACLDRGVTTFDTAEIYGDTVCEQQLGQALRKQPGLRQRIQLISKTGIFKTKLSHGDFTYYDTSYDRVIQSCKESLDRLATDYLDLYLIHREDPCINFEETARALLDLKREGLVREIGVSNFDPYKFSGLQKWTHGQLVTNQIEWNPLCFEHFNSGMFDLLGADGIHPLIWSPLAGGKLFTGDDLATQEVRKVLDELAQKYQADPSTIVYAWIFYHPSKAAVISGSRKLNRLDLAAKAFELELDRSDWFRLYAASGQQTIR